MTETPDIEMLVNACIMADLSRLMLIREGVPDHEVQFVYHETLGTAISDSGSGGVPLVMGLAHFAAVCVEQLAEAEGITGPMWLQRLALRQANATWPEDQST